MQDFTDKLRPLVGVNGWDYCVLWKLSEDQRFLELMGYCCCAGTENIQEGVGKELPFSVSSVIPCRDVTFQHSRTQSCDLLSLLPSSMPLDSGIHAQVLLSNQPRWLNFSNNSDSCLLEETVGTKVLVPVPGGLVELFVAKQVPEDQQLMHCISVQYNISSSLEQQTMTHNMQMQDPTFSVNVNTINVYEKDPNNPFNPPISPSMPLDNLNLAFDIPAKRIRLCNSPMNFFQQFNCAPTPEGGDAFLNEKLDGMIREMDELNKPMMSHNGSISVHLAEALGEKEQQHQQQQGNHHKDSVKQEMGRSESISDCSDPNEEEDDPRFRRRTGKGSPAKNLQAERRRRKKLNDRLYALRALVPNISKLDRASILGDAIEYVKELQKQEKDLQQELEEHSDDEDGTNKNNGCSEILKQNGVQEGQNKLEHDRASSWFHMRAPGNGLTDSTRPNHHDNTKFTNDKVPQMEPQVEVAQLDENKFFVKVFCEHKPGGFVRLMEALNSLGLEVTNVNVTSCTSLVSNVFNVVKRDSEMVQADHVRDSLLEITRNPSGGWPEMIKLSPENANVMDCHHQHHRSHQVTTLHHHHHSHHVHN